MAVTAEQRTRLLKMLTSQQIDTIGQGVELFVALDDDELWDEVLADARFDDAHERQYGHGKRKTIKTSPGRLVGTSFFKWNTRTTRWDELVLRMLVARSSSPIKEQVTGLDIGGRLAQTTWLPLMSQDLAAFPNLAELVVYSGGGEFDLSGLGAMPALRHLTVTFVAGAARTLDLPDLPHLEDLSLRTRATVSLGKMPHMQKADLWAPHVANPAAFHTVRSLTLTRECDAAILDHCPDLRELTCPILRAPVLKVPPNVRLMNGSLKVRDVTDLGNLAVLGNLQLLELVPGDGDGPVEGLESLAKCADLRVLDIRGHHHVSDLSFFQGHPNLRMIAAHGTSVAKDSLPSSMTSIVSFAKNPNLTKALERLAPGEERPKAPPSKLSAAQRKTMSRLKKLFHTPDMDAIMQAVELVASLDDTLIWAELLDGVTYEKGGVLVNKDGGKREVVGRIVANKLFSGTLFRQPWLDVGLAHLVARSTSPLREQVTHLAVGQWSYSTSPLSRLSVDGFGGFPNLCSLQLLDAAEYDLATLADLGQLETLHINGNHVLPSHATLQRLSFAGEAGFEPGGTWPALVQVEGARLANAAPLAQGATELQQLSLRYREIKIVGFGRLTSLAVTGTLTIEDCPMLEQLSAGNLHTVGALPGLRRLSIRQAQSLDFLAQVPQLRELTIVSPVQVTEVKVVGSPTIVGPLVLAGVTNLGNIADLVDLQVLKLSDVDDPLSLEPLAAAADLRVLDVRGCGGVTDLSALEALPQLRMVAVHDSGVTTVPAMLNGVVSRAKDVDLAEAAARELPATARRTTSKPKKIPVPEAERGEWDAVLAGLATTDLRTALEAIDLAATLDIAGLEFLLSKISILRDQLRSRAPFRLPTRMFLPAIVARILSYLPADSVAAAPFRRMTKLVAEAERRYGAPVLLDGLEHFPALEHVFVHKSNQASFESIADSSITFLGIVGGQVGCGVLPKTLRTVYLEEVRKPNLSAFALDTIDELWLVRISGDVDLTPLIASPPKRILLGDRFKFQKPIDIPSALADNCHPAGYVNHKHFA